MPSASKQNTFSTKFKQLQDCPSRKTRKTGHKRPQSCWLLWSNGQSRVVGHKIGSPFHASPRASSYWPTPAQTRLWPNLKWVHPILAAHPPIGYPISITHTRLWPGYSTSSPHAHASSRDAAGYFWGRRGRTRGRTLTLLCSLYLMRLSFTRSYLPR